MEETHYQTLDVPETATAEEIKKAYRKLSLKVHPDRNVGGSSTNDAFQKISSAFEIIGNPDKRREYDAMRRNPHPHPHMFHSRTHMNPHMSMNMDDIISQIFFSGLGGGMGGMRQGQEEEDDSPFLRASGINIQGFRNGVPFQVPQMVQKPPPIIQTVYINMEQVL